MGEGAYQALLFSIMSVLQPMTATVGVMIVMQCQEMEELSAELHSTTLENSKKVDNNNGSNVEGQKCQKLDNA